MLWLKLMLVILISEIGERAMCSGSGPVPSVKESEKTPYSLPQESLINDTSDGCNRQLLPYLDENGMGVLTVNCTKYCTGDKQATDVNGNPCIFKVKQAAKPGKVKVKEGSCRNGTCVRGSTRPPWRLVVLGKWCYCYI
uniref:Putative evasin n=1 Tax=Ixodes ricinus TaxID=34613 RepID=A0A6B0USY2_IXORI